MPLECMISSVGSKIKGKRVKNKMVNIIGETERRNRLKAEKSGKMSRTLEKSALDEVQVKKGSNRKVKKVNRGWKKKIGGSHSRTRIEECF